MDHYMKETLLPLTTCERDGLLSHFAVHMLSGILFVSADILAFSKSHYSVCHTGRGNRGRSGSLLSDCQGQGAFSPCCIVLLRDLLHVSGR